VPPACERDTVSITLRKPSQVQIPHQDYIDAGFYNRVTGTEKRRRTMRNYWPYITQKIFRALWRNAWSTVKPRGGRGNQYRENHLYEDADWLYPLHLRITTIEDNPEITFFIHKNYVHLFYPSESADEKGQL
jgi:type IV secretion system protein VirB11